MNYTRRFIKTSFIYTIGQILVKIINFILLPVFTGILTPEDYGSFDVIIAAISVITPIAFFEIPVTMLRYICKYKDDGNTDTVITNSFFISLFSTLAYCIFFCILNSFNHFEMFGLILLYGITSGYNSLSQFLARGLDKNKVYMLSGIVNTVLYASLNIIFIAYLKLGIISLFFTAIIGNIVQIIIILISVDGLKRVNYKLLDKKLIFEMLRFSFPLVINCIAVWSSTSLSRLIVAGRMGTAVNGYIAIADKFLVIVSLFSTIINMTWQEMAFSISGKHGSFERYNKAFNMYFKALGMGITILIPLVAIIFPYLVNEQFNASRDIIPFYFLSAVFASINSFLINILTAEDKTRALLYSTIICTLFNISTLYLTMSNLGIIAYVIASIIGNFACFLYLYITINHEVASVKLGIRTAIMILVLFIVSCNSYYYYVEFSIPVIVVLAIIFSMAFKSDFKTLSINMLAR